MSMTRQTDPSRLSLTSGGKRSSRRDSISRAGIGSSTVSLVGLPRASIAFKTGKGGFKVPRYQNTYQLESPNPFKAPAVDKILENVTKTALKDVKVYDSKVCMKLCQDMAMEIRKQIFKKDFMRYKYIVTATIIQKSGQGIHTGLGFIWDAEKDNYSTYVHETLEYYAIVIVAGVYYD
ncbi:dynein light chain Tctex-type protein 2 [Diachasmimorpha longicaudata]|uniref:dynein light chain Tctex-type protein 2 n=1 Tax=Diachasmimorpha longicaudata TaxID=58733 RepID=UPI0030B907AF